MSGMNIKSTYDQKRPARLSYTLSLLRIPVAVASRPAAWCRSHGTGMRASASRVPTLKGAHPPYPVSLQGGRTKGGRALGLALLGQGTGTGR